MKDGPRRFRKSFEEPKIASNMAENPTSPLGVGGLERFLFHPSFFPFGEGFTPPPTPSPLTWTGGSAARFLRPRSTPGRAKIRHPSRGSWLLRGGL